MKPVFLSSALQVSPLILAATLFGEANPALSQASNIVTDDTLGEESSQVIENQNFNELPTEVITGGAQREQNLFHSFQEFNVSEGRGAYFNSPNVDVQNIFSRVTGSNPSEIMGVLGTFGESNPDLYLVNPNGIVFGENSSLDVQGSFTATTANGGIEFGEQGTYSAIDPQIPQLLTVDPSAYLFNQIENQAIGGITNQADLRVAPGEDIAFFSGKIDLINSSLVAPGGEIVLGSLEDITLVDTFVNVSSGIGGGLILFDAQNLEISKESTIGAGIPEGAGSPDAVTGDIIINVAEKFRIDNSYITNLLFDDAKGRVGNIEIFAGSVLGTNGTLIDTRSFGQGNAGIISITATDSVIFDGKGIDGVATGITSQIDSTAIGNAGDISITSRSLEFINGAQLETTTDGRGNAGNLTINVIDSVIFDGESKTGRRSGAFSFVRSNGNGDAGDINISSSSLKVLNGAELTSSITNIGNGGNITIDVTDSVIVDGESKAGRDSGIFTDVTSTGKGSAGSISITANALKILNGAIISSGTHGEGDAGSITISATGLVFLNGEDRDGSSSSNINSQVESGAKGNAGDITIDTSNLVVTDNAQISSGTFGTGNGGSININAVDSILLNGERQKNATGIGGQVALGAEGKGADILINTNNLKIVDGARVSSETFGKGDAGSITINAINSVIVNGEDINENNARIASSVTSEGEGNAGNISITTNSLEVLDGASISARTSGIGDAGSVKIAATDSVILDGIGSDDLGSAIASQVGSSGQGNGGGINIFTNSLQILNGAFIDASTFAEGDAGQIQIKAIDSITIEGSSEALSGGIFSGVNTNAEGNAGGIEITTTSLNLTNDALITVSTLGQGNAGKLEISADFLNLGKDTFILSRSVSGFDAGNITLNIANSLQAIDSDISTSSSQSSGGNLTISAGNIELRGDSNFRTNIASGEGSGGNIVIKASSIIAFDDSDIFASAPEGRGGDITLNTSAFFAENFTLNSLTADPGDLDLNARADVNATGAVSSGSVQIPDVSFIQNSLTELADDSINTDELVANSCVVPVGDRSQGKFIITGGESLPVRPGDNLPSKYPTGEVRSVTEDNTSSWQPGDPIVEPQGAYRLANGKMVLSRECS